MLTDELRAWLAEHSPREGRVWVLGEGRLSELYAICERIDEAHAASLEGASDDAGGA